MKRFSLTLAAFAAFATGTALGQTAPAADSVAAYDIQRIEVIATRATGQTPVAYSELSRKEIERNNYGLDIPSVLALTPSMIATNETGIGIGGTSMRLRGTAATRLNVTINGVSMHNPDSHAMYWYDTPDLISSVGDMQVQRGAGTSTNGTGAFGGAVSMTTAPLSTEFGGTAALSYGSYNTNKQSVHISSGLMGCHWMVDARLSHIGSDGYIDRGATDLKSYMLQGAYYGGNTMVKLVSFGGKAKTYLTYNGVSKEEMEQYGRRYHASGQYETSDGPFVLANGKHVNYYNDQTDNYLQINNQLILNHKFNNYWSLNATAFYTYGYGYFKQYKDDAWIMGYDNLSLGDVEQADLIRSKIMRNHLGGLNAAAFYNTRNLNLAFGGSYSYYTCPHWGTLNWIDGIADTSLYSDKIWYDNNARKSDANLFVKANWQLFEGFRLFGDMQYRYVHYKAWGTNDNSDWNKLEMQPIHVNNTYHFFNPHVGINYDLTQHHTLYASFAVAHREPTRNDFTDRYLFAETQEEPKAEVLYDYEVGYRLSYDLVDAGVNLYYMDYKDQLVYTGLVNDGGDNLNINVPESYRRGIELSLAVRPLRWFSFGGNATFSQNRIKNYQDHIDGVVFNRGDSPISYSPSTIASVFLDFHAAGFEAALRTQYVGKQYLTNGGYEDLTLDSYCVTNLNLGYTLRTKAVKSVRFGVEIYNLFDARYCSNGYGGSWLEGDTIADRGSWACYFPQAPLHVLANVTVNF